MRFTLVNWRVFHHVMGLTGIVGDTIRAQMLSFEEVVGLSSSLRFYLLGQDLVLMYLYLVSTVQGTLDCHV